MDTAAFLHAYTENIIASQHMMLDTAMAQAIERLVHPQPWHGTHTDLLDVLHTMVGPGHSLELPRTARALSAELDRLIPSLRSIGVRIERERKRQGGSGQRIITLRKEESGQQ